MTRITHDQRAAAVWVVHNRLKQESEKRPHMLTLADMAHAAVSAIADKGWVPPATRPSPRSHAELQAEVDRLRAAVDAVLALHPFTFDDPDDPDRTLGGPALWLADVEAALAGVSVVVA